MPCYTFYMADFGTQALGAVFEPIKDRMKKVPVTFVLALLAAYLPSLRTQCVTVLASGLSWMNNVHPNHGFNLDLKHAIMASRADVFVTADRRLRDMLLIGRAMLPFEPMNPADFLTRYSAT